MSQEGTHDESGTSDATIMTGSGSAIHSGSTGNSSLTVDPSQDHQPSQRHHHQQHDASSHHLMSKMSAPVNLPHNKHSSLAINSSSAPSSASTATASAAPSSLSSRSSSSKYQSHAGSAANMCSLNQNSQGPMSGDVPTGNPNPPPGFGAANIGYSFLAAAAAGYRHNHHREHHHPAANLMGSSSASFMYPHLYSGFTPRSSASSSAAAVGQHALIPSGNSNTLEASPSANNNSNSFTGCMTNDLLLDPSSHLHPHHLLQHPHASSSMSSGLGSFWRPY